MYRQRTQFSLRKLSTALTVPMTVLAMLLLNNQPIGFAEPGQVIPAPGSAQDGSSLQNKAAYGPAITNNHLSYGLVDESGAQVKPIAVARVEDDLYFLAPDSLWFCEGAKPVAGGEDLLVLQQLRPPKMPSLSTPWQECNDFVYLPSRKVLVILDKSGDLFEFSPSRQSFRIFRTNLPSTGPPDPDYVGLCSLGDQVALLDPERNQIWCGRGPRSRLEPYFREVLPWRLKPGDPNVSDGIAIGFAGAAYVLKRNGYVTKYDGKLPGHMHEHFLPYRRPAHLRPSRLCVSQDNYLYVVERENNRVVEFARANGACACFIFPQDSDLRGMVVSKDGFWIVNGSHFVYRSPDLAAAPSANIACRKLDPRLRGFILPIAGQWLPRHPGVYPGARRLYRYGVHEGLDMFNEPGNPSMITMGTPVFAAQAGRIIRADAGFKDMDAGRFSRVMSECRRQHYTSAKNEDLFRGCQVWIDHGNGVVTRYAHLSKIKPGLQVNSMVKRKDLIGFVGVSGTGEDLPGRIRYPHLHFEILVDGKYLGWGLTPAETMGVYEDVFGAK